MSRHFKAMTKERIFCVSNLVHCVTEGCMSMSGELRIMFFFILWMKDGRKVCDMQIEERPEYFYFLMQNFTPYLHKSSISCNSYTSKSCVSCTARVHSFFKLRYLRRCELIHFTLSATTIIRKFLQKAEITSWNATIVYLNIGLKFTM